MQQQEKIEKIFLSQPQALMESCGVWLRPVYITDKFLAWPDSPCRGFALVFCDYILYKLTQFSGIFRVF